MCYSIAMNKDAVDLIIAQWKRERPELDTSGFAVVARVLRLSRLLERRLDDALEPYGLQLWSFDVLATLRRNGAPYTMSPTQLLGSVMLTSGAMTNRLDRLEAAGLILRLPDPNDRRGVLVRLTEKGLRTVDTAVVARMQEARDAVKGINASERASLTRGLRELMLALEQQEEE